MNNNRKILIFVVFIFCIFCGVFYYFKMNNSSHGDLKSLSVKFNSSELVEIKNILPVSDKLGKKFNGRGTEEGIQGYVDFSIKNVGDVKSKFEIYITKKNNDDVSINGNYVKFYLTNGDDFALDGYSSNIIPTYDKLSFLNDKSGSKLLFRDVIKSKEKRDFKLRVWLSDSYAISKKKENFVFEIGVRTV